MAAIRRLIMNCGMGMGYWCGMDDVTRPRDDEVSDHVMNCIIMEGVCE